MIGRYVLMIALHFQAISMSGCKWGIGLLQVLFLFGSRIWPFSFKQYRHQKVIYWGWISAFTLVPMQVLSGALVIFTRLNLYIALLHALIYYMFIWGIKLFSTYYYQGHEKNQYKKKLPIYITGNFFIHITYLIQAVNHLFEWHPRFSHKYP